MQQTCTIKEFAIHLRNLKQALNYKLVLKTVHRVNKFSQKVWLKSYIDMNTELKRKAKTDFEKDQCSIRKKTWQMGQKIEISNL